MKAYSRKQKRAFDHSEGAKKQRKRINKTNRTEKKNLAANGKVDNKAKLFLEDWEIDYSTPALTLSSLLKPHELPDFFQDHWEKQPLILKRSKYPSVVSFFSKLFSKDILFEILQKHSLYFVQDINACCYTDGSRKNMNEKGRITVKKAVNLLEKRRATLQIHQPQRYVPYLWKLMERLECYFSCLVGANVYITPNGSQGLPPHYDDVEVFILQLEGEKEWKLYEPPILLPRTYSRDLTQEEIGKPTHQFTLKPGDMLYMPRGTVHQAKTDKSSCTHSTHITISTYQKHAIGDYIMSIFPSLLEEAMNSSQSYRQGLPIGFFSNFQIDQSTIQKVLEELPDIARKSKPLVPHSILCDFMQSRLPPFGIDRDSILECAPSGKPPSLRSSVHFAYPHHIAWAISDVEDDDDGSLHPQLLVYSSLANDHSVHMMAKESENEDSNALKFPVHFIEALEQLKSNSPHPLHVRNLKISDDEEKMQFVTSLWSQHLLL